MSVSIPPGQTRDLNLSIDLLKVQRQPLDEYRDFRISISATLKRPTAESSRVDWHVHGRVRAALLLDRAIVNLGRHSELAPAPPPVQVRVRVAPPFSGLTATSSSDRFAVTAKATGIDREYELTVVPRALAKGPIDAELLLTTRGSPADGQPIIVHLPLSGSIVDDVEATPPEVVFSPQPVGSDLEETITLGSLTGRPFSVVGANCSQSGTSLEAYPEQSITAHSYIVKKRITNIGTCRENITFDIQNHLGKRTQISVPTSYRGKANSRMVQMQQMGRSERR
jgi:hypothetical protein